MADFDEGHPGVAQSAEEGGRASYTTNMKIIADIEFFSTIRIFYGLNSHLLSSSAKITTT